MNTEREWPDLVRPEDIELNSILDSHRLQPAHFTPFRLFVDELVPMANQELADKRRLGAAHLRGKVNARVKDLDRLVLWSNGQTTPAPSGSLVMPSKWQAALSRSAGRHLNGILSPRALAKLSGMQAPTSPRQPFGGDPSRIWAEKVIRAAPAAALEVLLSAARDVMAETGAAMTVTGAKGGRSSYEVGRWLLMNLAKLYSMLGGKPSTDRHGPFGRFADDLVLSLGLPNKWVRNQLEAAIADWKSRPPENLPQK